MYAFSSRLFCLRSAAFSCAVCCGWPEPLFCPIDFDWACAGIVSNAMIAATVMVSCQPPESQETHATVAAEGLGVPLVITDHRFAVDHGSAGTQPQRCLDDAGQPIGPIAAMSRKRAHPVAVATDRYSIAVVLGILPRRKVS